MLSAHFSEDEMRCRHCGEVRVTCELVEACEKLRAIIRRPLPIVSGYRCPRHNRAVGGARRSQHVLGTAVDIPRGLARPNQAILAGFRGIGLGGGWVVHADVRPGPITHWYY